MLSNSRNCLWLCVVTTSVALWLFGSCVYFMAHTHVHISSNGLCLSQSLNKNNKLYTISPHKYQCRRDRPKKNSLYLMRTMCCETNKGKYYNRIHSRQCAYIRTTKAANWSYGYTFERTAHQHTWIWMKEKKN